IDAWLRGPLREWAECLLAPAQLRSNGFVRVEPVRRAWREHLAGDRNWQYPLWTVLMLQAWREGWGWNGSRAAASVRGSRRGAGASHRWRICESYEMIDSVHTARGTMVFYCPGDLAQRRAWTLLTTEPETISQLKAELHICLERKS